MRKTNPLIHDDFYEMLVSVLAHDLRQPFSALIMAADMFKHTRRRLSQNELHMLFEDLRSTAAKSIELLDGLLYWQKSNKEGFAYQAQPLLLHDLVHEANSLYLVDQLQKKVSLYNIVPERQLIFAHKQMLQFVNRNILSNATKYSPPGGSIGVTCSQDGGQLTVAFTDQGSGMSATELQQLFSGQAHTTDFANHSLQGAGIALSICRDMMGKMNGRLWAESTPGSGTTFYYTLPYEDHKHLN